MESDQPPLRAPSLADIPREITQMIIRHVPIEDLKNVACVCLTVHAAAADVLQHRQELIREYQHFDIDVLWLEPQRWESFGWDVPSGPIIGLCTILEHINLGHYIREITYTADSSQESCGWYNLDSGQGETVHHHGALAMNQNIRSLQDYLQENQLRDDTPQGKLLFPRGISDPHQEWTEVFVEHLKIDYGLYLRILLPMLPNLTTLEISWNFDSISAINKFMEAASNESRPYLQHLTKVKLLLGRRPHRMDIGAFMAVPSLRWLSIYHLLGFNEWECRPSLVGYSNLTRLELVDCAICDQDLTTYFGMFKSLQNVSILRKSVLGEELGVHHFSWRNTKAVDGLLTHCGNTVNVYLC